MDAANSLSKRVRRVEPELVQDEACGDRGVLESFSVGSYGMIRHIDGVDARTAIAGAGIPNTI